ncbi:HDOD domain-containing protein [Gilvimarinus agarilyticus]|uniref:HDOD domain-containing protein n=1 Tax=unclassified Gilvimarinus TaxID=2642066 RepID=UPI001C085764|nr:MULTISPECIES: HDOD domain-containing protein [unclassified Gilvimarinus]MBU2885004.1 HDOD domain-containing protein [Gilvimarinus agarilyticus]MDO6569901.1 HDOD domain-containing protein [Gilvimarinus sp. 2_MG-2023]MDO6747110.1 HDOD domain-containing protein [Gilvimarinus sp. 1_MG-2023]
MSQVVNTVRQDIIAAIKSDKLVLPTLPEAALKVREVAEDPDADMDQLTNVIGNDAALSARIVRVANSPLLRANKAIEDLKTAVMRLGIAYTCNIATGLAMQQMFQATSDLVDKRMRDTWTRASEIAGISHVLCRHYTKLRPDQATLAGLIHKIGVLPILTYAEDHPSLLKDSLTLDTVINQLQGPIGDLILKAWDFPDELSHVPSQHMKFDRQTEQADYADIVTVAMLQSYLGSDSPLGKVDYHQVSAFNRLGMDPDMQMAEGEDLSDEMEAAMTLLQ